MDYKIKEETLSGIADAIRSKSGSSKTIKVSEFAEQIGTISTGSFDIQLIENLPIAVDFSQGNQFIEAPEGQAVKSAVIQKPANLKAENIAKNVNIAGVTGTLEPFEAEILENIPIELDFSNGNQTIEAEEGSLVKSATVFKPGNLVPENIAEGINIAGIVGTLAAGGGANVKVLYGTFTGTGTAQTITHNFGVIPDLAFLFAASAVATSAYASNIGFSNKMISDFGLDKGGFAVYGNGSPYSYSSKLYIEKAPGQNAIGNANETTITLGSSFSGYLASGVTYYYLIIGGLT